MTPRDERPLVLHVVFRLAVGGLENGVINLINWMPAADWRHAILALTDIDENFSKRIQRDDVIFESLHKRPGHLIKQFPQVYSLLKRLRPTIVHTRNLGTLETQVPAWAAGVPVRIHGEHGWDVSDPAGTRIRYQFMRRLYVPFVHQYITVSSHLKEYLVRRVGVDERIIMHLCNGVDSARFAPTLGGRAPIAGCPFVDPDLFVVGTVGRLQEVKDQVNLAHAFVHAMRICPSARDRLRLAIVGDGPLRTPVVQILRDAGLDDLAWLPGERHDVPDVLRGLDLFVLPSRAEGISNTILEAMSTGLPVVATDVGGNSELVDDGITGTLVPASDSARLGDAILTYYKDPTLRRRHAETGRKRIVQKFNLDGMVARQAELYQRLLRAKGYALQASSAV
ncbi:MAG: TIGR03088 family PEP-CTERM/XrtA system glycosyltransferase [Burkholderiales bacterium]